MPRPKSFKQTVLAEYDKGASYQAIADKHEVTVAKVAGIIEADQAKKAELLALQEQE